MLPKIDLEIEHVLIGVENRRRFSESKIGAGFRLRVSSALQLIQTVAEDVFIYAAEP